MTANASSSSAVAADRRPSVDLSAAGLLPPLPAAFLDGRDLDLLAPLSFAASDATQRAVAPDVDREDLARGLAEANDAYGHPAASDLAQRLAAPQTLVVVTGQQPGLFGGPLYTLTKAVAASLWAERLTAAGRPAVAVFWIATEDHDWRESSWAAFETPEGLLRLDLGEDPAPLAPLGMRTLGAEVEPALARLREAVPGDEAAARISTLGGRYRPAARFGEAFARLLVDLLGDRCPLLLDSMLPAVKRAEAPWLERLVERREEVGDALAAADRRIVQAGYPLQVEPQPGLSPLFALRGGERRRVEWNGDGGWLLRGAEGGPRPVAELLETVRENPGVVSPGVLARPLVQDAILGTAVQVMGPGEVSYLPQLAPLYSLLGVAAPLVALRPQALVLEGHRRDKLAELPLDLADLVGPELDLDRALAGDAPEEIVGPARHGVEQALEQLKRRAVAVDPDLAGPWGKTRGQMEKALGIFTGKVTAALARRQEVARRRAEDLRQACRPAGQLQERMLSSFHFAARHGDAFVDALFEQLDLDPRRLQVVTP
ncbi:MAG: bacillithiol biosynthesis cysteine-adding enzyme BshC [Thermoanaerobaculia bacterium]